jgi:hypothetical protein
MLAPALGFAKGGLGAAIIGGAAGGFVGGFSGTLLYGGSLSDALSAGLRGGAIAALTAGLTYGVDGIFPNWANTSKMPLTKRYGMQIGRTISNAAVKGLSAELRGGDFEQGFVLGIESNLVNWGIEAFTEVSQTWGPPKDGAVFKGEGGIRRNQPEEYYRKSHMGTQATTREEFDKVQESDWGDYFTGELSIGHLLHEGSPLMRSLSFIPGANSASVFHDMGVIPIGAFFGEKSMAFGILNPATIPPFFAAEYIGLGAKSHMYEAELVAQSYARR